MFLSMRFAIQSSSMAVDIKWRIVCLMRLHHSLKIASFVVGIFFLSRFGDDPLGLN